MQFEQGKSRGADDVMFVFSGHTSFNNQINDLPEDKNIIIEGKDCEPIPPPNIFVAHMTALPKNEACIKAELKKKVVQYVNTFAEANLKLNNVLPTNQAIHQQ
ncbi:hypothetical protein ACFE04_020903 [Oxalis oulophora]